MKTRSDVLGARTAVALAAALLAGSAGAMDFDLDGGWKGSWTSSISLGTAIRAKNADPRLIGQDDGALVGMTNGSGANTIDVGNLNYRKGDPFTTEAKLLTEVAFHKDDLGGLLRAKAWYDYTLIHSSVHFGSQNNGYNNYNFGTNSLGAPAPLKDTGYDALNRFQGVYLLDAYVYDTFTVADKPLQVRLGNQVVNWGESLFIQGLNQTAPIDVPSFHKPGVQLKEVFLPVPMLFSSLGLGDAGSIEAFYQFQWKATPLDLGCGNYWAIAASTIQASTGPCSQAVTLTKSEPFGHAAGAYYPFIDGKKGSNSGEYGLAYRFNSNALDTEFGLYAQRLNSRTPTLDIRYGTYPGTVSPAAASWDYIDDVKIYGISASTNLLGISLAGELSESVGVPAQISGADLLFSSLAAAGAVTGSPIPFGPAGSLALAAAQGNKFFQGYTRANKTQFQINAVKAGNKLLGSDTYIAIGEVGFQWNNLPDYKTNSNAVRYGRAFIFGAGQSPLYGVPAGSPACGAFNISPEGCRNDGYITRFAWGYRLKLDLIYNNVASTGVTVTPSIFFSDDVSGYSIDSQFSAQRQTLGLGVKFAYDKRYTLELGYVTFNHNAAYDPLRDRDFYSATVGVSF